MERRKPSRKPKQQQKVAQERVEKLAELAQDYFQSNPSLSNRYAQLILKISMRHNVRLPPEIKKRVCRNCETWLVPGFNSRVRTSPTQRAVIVKCFKCGNVTRHPYRKEKKLRG